MITIRTISVMIKAIVGTTVCFETLTISKVIFMSSLSTAFDSTEERIRGSVAVKMFYDSNIIM